MTENQHWVPKFLLKHFADKGRVFSFDIPSGVVGKMAPKKAASERGFYDYEVDGQIVSFEDRLEKIETKAAPAIRRIVETNSLVGLSGIERIHVAFFIAAQSFRTKAFYEGLAQKPSRQEFLSTLEELWRGVSYVARVILRRHWALMVIYTEEVFYLGDHPVVLQRSLNPKDGTGLGFDVVGVDAYLPLSPKCALYLPCHTISGEIIERYKDAMATRQAVQTAILQSGGTVDADLEASELADRPCHQLYKALTVGEPFAAITEYVDTINALQCGWALQAIYSNRNDFAFARRVFGESPQYRGVPQTSVIQRGTVLVPDGSKEWTSRPSRH